MWENQQEENQQSRLMQVLLLCPCFCYFLTKSGNHKIVRAAGFTLCCQVSCCCMVMMLLILLIPFGGEFGYMMLRKNTYSVSSTLNWETTATFPSAKHHPMLPESDFLKHTSDSDLIKWKGEFYLAMRSAHYDNSGSAKLFVLKSNDSHTWSLSKSIDSNQDIRYPKFASIGNTLFLYILKRYYGSWSDIVCEYMYTTDGGNWTFFNETQISSKSHFRVNHPRSPDGKAYYTPLFSSSPSTIPLYETHNGQTWKAFLHSYPYDESDGYDTSIGFGPTSGQLYAVTTTRSSVSYWTLKSIFGDNERGSWMSVSDGLDYTKFRRVQTLRFRTDRSCVVVWNGRGEKKKERVVVIGRAQVEEDAAFFGTGGLLSRKRTGIYYWKEDEGYDALVYLSDFPSGGDTAPGGCFLEMENGMLWISYYSNANKDGRVQNDWPWAWGMWRESKVFVLKINISSVENMIESRKEGGGRDIPNFPIWDYVIFFSLCFVCFCIIVCLCVASCWMNAQVCCVDGLFGDEEADPKTVYQVLDETAYSKL